MGEDFTHLQISALCAHNYLCRQSNLGFRNNTLVVISFNLYLLVEISKGIELGFLLGVVEFYIWRITFEQLFSESSLKWRPTVSLIPHHPLKMETHGAHYSPPPLKWRPTVSLTAPPPLKNLTGGVSVYITNSIGGLLRHLVSQIVGLKASVSIDHNEDFMMKLLSLTIDKIFSWQLERCAWQSIIETFRANTQD